jgi:predicted polyphosphate/ATP-dependent NAD kinase
MGEDAFRESGADHRYSVVYRPGEQTTADDTRSACRIFAREGVDIVVFCGGDGTARDVYDVIGTDIPLLGIPAGVKMHSGVFGITPKAAAEVLDAFVSGEARIEEGEVVDLDEDDYRAGRIDLKLHGYASVPVIPELVQDMKTVFTEADEAAYKDAIAAFVREIVQEDLDALYILGPGSTVRAVARALGVDKTLLGVDLYAEGRIIASDVGERQILEALERFDRERIIATPIGAQGFVFGRGNQQISPEVIRRVGPNNVMVVATPRKLRSTPFLRVDTGDPEVDALFSGYLKVISGYHDYIMKKVQ